MKRVKRFAGTFLCAAVSVSLLCGCSSTALPVNIPDEVTSAARTVREDIGNLIEKYTGLSTQNDTGDAGSGTGDGQSGEGADEGNTQEKQENRSLYYYYNQLSTDEKSLYDALLSVAGNPSDNSSGETVRLSVSPDSDKFQDICHVTYGALISDHPELFWLTQGDGGFLYTYPKVSLTGTYPVNVKLKQAHTDAPQMVQQLEGAAQSLLSQVDLSQSSPQVALQIHDRLIDLVSYDSEVAQKGGTDLAHTAYGALVADSSGNANHAVCDGYTYAYEYLLQKAGIECAVVNGYAGPDAENAQSHSWILVSLDGQWYETDPTWDDVDLSGTSGTDYSALQRQALSDSVYVEKLRHYLYDVTTDQMSSFTPDERYTYRSFSGWASFLGSSVHIRNQAGDESKTGDYTTPLAPTAEGTQYSYSNLTGN